MSRSHGALRCLLWNMLPENPHQIPPPSSSFGPRLAIVGTTQHRECQESVLWICKVLGLLCLCAQHIPTIGEHPKSYACRVVTNSRCPATPAVSKGAVDDRGRGRSMAQLDMMPLETSQPSPLRSPPKFLASRRP